MWQVGCPAPERPRSRPWQRRGSRSASRPADTRQERTMRITFAMSSPGLFYAPGLAEPVVLDLAALPPADAARIEALVRDARVLDRPAAPESPPMPDARCFTLTVEQGGRS